MISSELKKFIRPIRRKLFVGKMLVHMARFTIATGIAVLLMSIISHFVPFLYVEWYMFYAWLAGILAAVVWSVIKRPSLADGLKMTDSLGYKERLLTAWQFKDDVAEEVMLQRQDTIDAMKGDDLRKTFKINMPVGLWLRGIALFVIAVGLLFIESPVRKDTKATQAQIETIQLEEAKLADEVEKLVEESDVPDALKEEMEALMKELAEKLKNAKTEEEALKALSIAKDELKKMEMKDLQKALEQLEKSLNGMDEQDLSEMTEEELQAKKDALEKALEALEQQKEELGEDALEQAEGLKEALEALQEAMANEDSEAASESAAQAAELTEEALAAIQNASEASQSMQAAVNASGQSLSTNPTISELAFSPSEQSDGSDSVATQGSQGQSGSQSGSQGQQAGAGQGQGNQGQSGQGQGQGQGSQQGQGGGSGQGQGSTNEDGGYSEEDGGSSNGWFQGEEKSGDYEALYPPNRIGGESEPNFVQGNRGDGGESQVKQVEGAPAMTGDLISYKELYAEYSEQAFHTVEDMEIPVLMKDLVKDYFTSLE